MAYTVTIWVDGSEPFINAINLNKIETALKTAFDHSEVTHAPTNAEVNTVGIAENNVFTASQRGQIEVLTYAVSVAPDLLLSNRYKCVLTGGAEIANPTNVANAQGGLIYLEQDATGGHAVTWGTNWKFLDVPTEDTTGLKVNVYAYEVYSPTQIVVSYIGAF